VIAEDGLGFSGGQSQRIAFIRLMFAPTPLILLDEPTASLDSHHRQLVIQQLRELAKNAIVIVASHDRDILELADHHLKLQAPIDINSGVKHDG
jgi:ATP-binding cassette, subfamily C, bacterial CydD